MKALLDEHLSPLIVALMLGPNQAVTITAACRASGAKSDRHNTTPPPTQWGQNRPSYWGQVRLSRPPRLSEFRGSAIHNGPRHTGGLGKAIASFDGGSGTTGVADDRIQTGSVRKRVAAAARTTWSVSLSVNRFSVSRTVKTPSIGAVISYRPSEL